MDFYHSPVAVWVNSAPQPKHWGPRAHRGSSCAGLTYFTVIMKWNSHKFSHRCPGAHFTDDFFIIIVLIEILCKIIWVWISFLGHQSTIKPQNISNDVLSMLLFETNNASWQYCDMESISASLTLCEGKPLVNNGFLTQTASKVELWSFPCC